MARNDVLLRTVERLLSDGERCLRSTEEVPHFGTLVSDLHAFAKWLAGCRNLMRLLGGFSEPWNEPFAESCGFRRLSRAQQMHATLEAIQDGLLVRVDELVSAEIFSDLLEQAEHLLSEGYYLAAGVIGRAVLEEHLRKWCDIENCVPSKPRPTLGDFNTELYKAKHLTKTEMKHVDSLISVGNDAAYNKPELKEDDVQRMIPDVRTFLAKYALR